MVQNPNTKPTFFLARKERILNFTKLNKTFSPFPEKLSRVSHKQTLILKHQHSLLLSYSSLSFEKKRKTNWNSCVLVVSLKSRMQWTQKTKHRLGFSGSEPLLQRSAIFHHAILRKSALFHNSLTSKKIKSIDLWWRFFAGTSSEGNERNQASRKSETAHHSLSHFLTLKPQKSPQTVPVISFYHFPPFFCLIILFPFIKMKW